VFSRTLMLVFAPLSPDHFIWVTHKKWNLSGSGKILLFQASAKAKS